MVLTKSRDSDQGNLQGDTVQVESVFLCLDLSVNIGLANRYTGYNTNTGKQWGARKCRRNFLLNGGTRVCFEHISW